MLLAAMTKGGGKSIGSIVREVITIDTDGEGIAWRKFLRIRVKLDIAKPFA